MYTNVDQIEDQPKLDRPANLSVLLSHASLAGHVVLCGYESPLTRLTPLFREERLMVSHVHSLDELDVFMLGSQRTIVVEVVDGEIAATRFSTFAMRHPEVLCVGLIRETSMLNTRENLVEISLDSTSIEEEMIACWRDWNARVTETLEARLACIESLLPSYTGDLEQQTDLALIGEQIGAEMIGFVGADGSAWWSRYPRQDRPVTGLKSRLYSVMTPMEIAPEHTHQYLECRMGMPGLRTLIVPVEVQHDCRSFMVVQTRQKKPWTIDMCAQLRIVGQSRAFRLLEPEGECLDVIVELLVQTLSGKDGYTAQHSDRVAILAREIAIEMSLSEEDVQLAYLGGRLHDIGKLWVDDHFLTKPGPLTPEEYESLKAHTTAGYDLMNRFERLRKLRDIVLSHHERMDGRGYPNGLCGARIPLTARIVSVADAYDAMTTDRSYRRGRPSPAALEELNRCAGEQFDVDVVKAFNTVFYHLENHTHSNSMHSAVGAR